MMEIRSMTGYGKSESVINNKKITLEIRSLNSKQMDLNLRLPQAFRILEMDLRKLVSSKAIRGKVDVTLSYESLEGVTSAVFNENAFKTYFNTISKTVNEVGLNIQQQEMVSAILRLPEVMLVSSDELNDGEKQEILNICVAALDALEQFRIKEGKVLIDDILLRITHIEEGLKQIEPYEKARIERVKGDIEANLNKLELNAAIDKNRFEQEIIYYLEKMDITEEKVRLAQHCSFFRQTVKTESYPGRKLGFIAQEIGREINTIGSKAGEANMQKLVVEMKDELEKIKEQLLNIL